ncbi:hypothetical protein HG537_0A00980 [Torulaspora globosa]|uniref:2',3'-cyclic-nucleotide 3'-phosphodiesterase n=1 Tax=Torulaspora globosa TaxID=48254 RepID=A0A7H9HKY8_9SACH|nr:hypothetical protein HG537_0A00980 [Torulaspora sp. CBS 2947]
MTIALWYCPQQGSAAYEILELLIESLQSIFPSSPRFEPHITITNNLVCKDSDDVNKILTSCVAAVQSIKPVLGSAGSDEPLVSFKDCSVGKKFFNKVVLDCRENRYLISIAQIMRELYVEIDDTSRSQRAATWARDEFRPHLSLLYSETYPISQAFLRIIQQRVEDALDVQLHSVPTTSGDRQLVWQLSSTPSCSWSLPGTFKVVKCEGPVGEWQVLGRTDV